MKSAFRHYVSLVWERLTDQRTVNFATVGGFVVGAAALMFSACQAQSSANSEIEQVMLARELSADRSWEAYMQIAFENPKFAEGANYPSLDKDEKIRYSWFVERLFYAAESILVYAKNDPQWNHVFELELRKHQSIIDNHARLLGAYPIRVGDYWCDHDLSTRRLMAKFSGKAKLALKRDICKDGVSNA